MVTLNTPDCLNAVSNATSLPANAPVCEDAASAPAELEPEVEAAEEDPYDSYSDTTFVDVDSLGYYY